MYDVEVKVSEKDLNIEVLMLSEEAAKKMFTKAFAGIRIQQFEQVMERLAHTIGELPKITINDPIIKTILKDREKILKKMTTTTNKLIKLHAEDAIKKAVNEGLSRAETIDEIAGRINKSVFKSAEINRSKLIARTETTAVSNAEQVAIAKEAGFPKKMWITQRDAQVRDEHAAMDGETVKADDAFSNGLMYPQEPNCRCDTMPIA